MVEAGVARVAMTDYKKLATDIVDHWITKGAQKGLHIWQSDAVILQDAIAQALEEAATPKVIQDEEIFKLAHEYEDKMLPEVIRGVRFNSFVEGARHAANQNLMRALDEVWPTKEEFEYWVGNVGCLGDSLAVMECYDWLKETLTARLK